MSNQNELLLCRAIAKVLGSRLGENFKFINRPDEEERTKEAIDAYFEGSRTNLATEHTLIESFPEQIKNDHHFTKFTQPLEKRLKGILPSPGKYEVVIEPLALKGVKKINEVQDSLYSWIIQKAPQLELGSPKTAPRHSIKEQPPGVPFKVTLQRWPGRDGQIWFARSIPDTLEKNTEERIENALSGKCPKLSEAKKDGITTALVLELNDIPLGETIEVSKLIVASLKSKGRKMDLPDYVFLVRTEVSEEFEITYIKESDLYFPHICSYEPCYFDTRTFEILD